MVRKLKTFWTCTACKAIYLYQRSGFNHLATAHDWEGSLKEFTPEYQQQLIDGDAEFRKQLQAAIARVDEQDRRDKEKDDDYTETNGNPHVNKR